MSDTKLTVDTIAKLQEKIAKQEQVNQELWAENEDLEEKLEKIEQIIDDYDLEAWEILEKIKEVFRE